MAGGVVALVIPFSRLTSLAIGKETFVRRRIDCYPNLARFPMHTICMSSTHGQHGGEYISSFPTHRRSSCSLRNPSGYSSHFAHLRRNTFRGGVFPELTNVGDVVALSTRGAVTMDSLGGAPGSAVWVPKVPIGTSSFIFPLRLMGGICF